MHYVYFIRSLKTDKVYVGFTSKDVFKRLREHNLGKNSWANINKPFELIYYESFWCEKDARKKEKFYKTGFGQQIKTIIIKYLKEKIGSCND